MDVVKRVQIIEDNSKLSDRKMSEAEKPTRELSRSSPPRIVCEANDTAAPPVVAAQRRKCQSFNERLFQSQGVSAHRRYNRRRGAASESTLCRIVCDANIENSYSPAAGGEKESSRVVNSEPSEMKRDDDDAEGDTTQAQLLKDEQEPQKQQPQQERFIRKRRSFRRRGATVESPLFRGAIEEALTSLVSSSKVREQSHSDFEDDENEFLRGVSSIVAQAGSKRGRDEEDHYGVSEDHHGAAASDTDVGHRCAKRASILASAGTFLPLKEISEENEVVGGDEGSGHSLAITKTRGNDYEAIPTAMAIDTDTSASNLSESVTNIREMASTASCYSQRAMRKVSIKTALQMLEVNPDDFDA